MPPLMQVLFEELRACAMDRYIDRAARDTYDMELERLYKALSILLPEHCRELFKQYVLVLRARDLIDMEAMFQAAFAAARELR